MSEMLRSVDFLQSPEYATYRQELAGRTLVSAAQDQAFLGEATEKTFNQAAQAGGVTFYPGLCVGALVGFNAALKEPLSIIAVPIVATLCGGIAAAAIFTAALPVTAAINYGKYAVHKVKSALHDFYDEGDKMGEAVGKFRNRLDGNQPNPSSVAPV